MKRFFGAMLTVLLLVSIVTVGTLPVSAATAGTCGENLTWSYNESTGTLIITGTGEMTNYDYSNQPWHEYRDLIQSVSLPQGLTTIGYSAFSGCRNLASIVIPGSVTHIGEGAFSGCGGLTSITIPNSVTTIGEDAFFECLGLTSLTLSNSITIIGEGAFAGCDGLTQIIVNAGNLVYHSSGNCLIETKSKTLIQGCKTSTIPADGSVTVIGDEAFFECTGLTSVTIPNRVTTIGDSAFYGCSGLTSLTIPSSITTIGKAAFRTCDGLTSVIIPNSVTTIGEDVFSWCTGLTSVTIPNSVTAIGEGAFSWCRGLTSVTISSSVTTIGKYAFYYCDSLTSVTIPGSITTIGDGAFQACRNLKTVNNYSALPIAKGSEGYGEVAYYADTVNQYDPPATPAAPIATIRMATSFKVKTYAGYEYKIEGGAWQSSPTFTGLKPGTSYKVYQRVAAKGYYAPSASSPALIITTRQRGPAAPAAPIATIRAATSFKVKTYAGYEYKINNGPWQKSATFTGLKPGTAYKVYQRVAATATHNASNPSEALTITTRLRGPAAPAAPVATIRTTTSIKVKTVAGYEYRIGNGAWQTSATFTGLKSGTTYKIYQRVAQTDTHNPSDSSPALTVSTK